MRILKAAGNRFIRSLRQDAYRVPLQTVAAVLLAYVAMLAISPDDTSWGVFSALFVVQASIGGTVGTALSRMFGALLGAVIAVALVMVLGVDGWRGFVALCIGVAGMSLLTARWPSLSYGLVTVTIIVVAPDFYVVEGALKKLLAIVIGSTCGMIAAVAVLPVTAYRNVQSNVAAALRDCGVFLVDCTACLVGERPRKGKQASRDITRALERAREMAQHAVIEEKTPTMATGLFAEALVSEVEKFRYTLTLIDRFSDTPMSETLQSALKAELNDLAETAQSQLDHMAQAIEVNEPCEGMDAVWNSYKQFSERTDVFVKHGESEDADREPLMAIKQAYYSIVSHLGQLCEHVNRRFEA
jgi:uncharacterized membrane protein YccC